MVEKLLAMLLQGKGVAVAVVASGALVSGVVGGETVKSLVTQAAEVDLVLQVDAPTQGQDLSGVFSVTGYALDTLSEDGPGISKVEVYVDGLLRGEATLGVESPEAVELYAEETEEGEDPDTRFATAGWAFSDDFADLDQATNHVMTVLAYSAADEDETIEWAIEVSDPLVGFTSPEPGEEVTGVVTVTGWAFDRFSAGGTEPTTAQIDRVELYHDGTNVGNATLGGASPDDVDVAGAGWTFDWDVSALEPGETTLTARAFSSAQAGAFTEASLLVIVFDPEAEDGNGCGWLVGEARGKAIQALQSGWQGFHTETMAYNSKASSADFSNREALRGTVQQTREGLLELRNTALHAIHSKASEYLALCEAGQLPPEALVTIAQDVVDTSGLIYEYRTIVDQAMVDMEALFSEAQAELDELSISTGEQPGGKPEGAGRPDGVGGPPPGEGPPDDR
ncbi:MAG: Ig-like domain-containing protein [Candidatus Limnocylindria bacterium]